MKKLIILLVLLGNLSTASAFNCTWRLVDGLYQEGIIYLKYRNTCTGEVLVESYTSPFIAM